MKPVAIFRFTSPDNTSYFSDYLDRIAIPWRFIRVNGDKAVPKDISQFSGLCLMGGCMSVNDPLPWIPQIIGLIHQAIDNDTPVIGHCLGGQLLAKALGASVTKNPVKEIGWGQVRLPAGGAEKPHATQVRDQWLGDTTIMNVFQWHGETFARPPGAIQLLEGTFCKEQAFVFGKHLAMQFHIEVNETMIRSWCQDWDKEGVPPSSSVQTPTEIHENLPERLSAMRQLTDRLYGQWIKGLQHQSAA